MKAKTFDSDFDSGKNVSRELDLSKARRVNQAPQRVNVDFPVWMVEALDREAKRLGVTRQSIIKVWLAERLEQTGVDFDAARARLDSVRKMLKGRTDTSAEDLVSDMRDDRTRDLSR